MHDFRYYTESERIRETSIDNVTYKNRAILVTVRWRPSALVGWWDWSRIFRQICALPGTQTNGAYAESISISPELMRICHFNHAI
jgi:hypothetical protein